VYRLLYTLQENGFITRSSEGKRYNLGLRLWEYGITALNGSKVHRLALHHLPQLAAQCAEPVNLSVYDRGEVLYLETVSRDVQGTKLNAAATRVPAHCSAAGKAMLAYQPDDEVERYCAGGIVGATPNTITSAEQLTHELAEIRELGYAVNRGEWHPTACGIAVPLLDHTGHAVAAIGVVCPASRFSQEFIDRVAQPALSHAREISRALGHREPQATWLAIS
jgi:DNA-binding IclR family transcriptional regulator